ncbi:MAG TPA: hypothetical protein VF221_18000 [Chloroflexota bacterium]
MTLELTWEGLSMKSLLNGRAVTILLTVIITASLTILWGPLRSTTPVLGAGADKIAISAAVDTIINSSQQPNPTQDATALLAQTTFSTSTTEDLVINFSTECGVYTAVGAKNGGSNTTGVTTSSTAEGKVVIWVQIDGNMLPVSQNATSTVPTGTGNGMVTYCDRNMNLSTQNLSPSQQITLAENTLDANSFQWFDLNVGNGSHTLKVYATLTQITTSSQTGGGSGSTTCGPTDPAGCYPTPAASALVGQRTLEVFPDHLANTASF